MVSKIGKISTIKRDHSGDTMTMEKSLANSRHKLTRVPGAGFFKFPYKELDGKYRTGLDPDASYIKRIQDSLEKELEKERVTKLKERLQAALGDIDLGPRSPFWNYALAVSTNDELHVQPYKLMDGDNLFDLNVPFQELTFSWLRVHPTIASSYQAWERGEFPADTQFFVADDDIENEVAYKKKQKINKAIEKLNNMTPEKQKKVARLLGLPVSDNSKESSVYNLIDTALKQTEFKAGKYQGLSPVEIFTGFADMKEDLLHIRDLVKQAILHSIYRVRGNNRIYEGEFEVAKDEEELIKMLLNVDNQDMLFTLTEKVKAKKIAAL
jgi:hypothetical protein